MSQDATVAVLVGGAEGLRRGSWFDAVRGQPLGQRPVHRRLGPPGRDGGLKIRQQQIVGAVRREPFDDLRRELIGRADLVDQFG